MLNISGTYWKKEEKVLFDIEKIESIFFEVLKDLENYLKELTLVGGWMPYVYSKFLWDNLNVKPVTTVDIDFGFDEIKKGTHSRTIFEILSKLDYTERRPRVDRTYPVVLYKQGKVPVDFITFPEISKNVIDKLIGRQININKIEKFDFLLQNKMHITVNGGGGVYSLNCPKPSAFLYHKAITFTDRENDQKKAKDLYYMYFVLRYAPNIETIFQEIDQYKKVWKFNDILKKINEYFGEKSGLGNLLVEKENGPDMYIDDLRQDIFDRFGELREHL